MASDLRLKLPLALPAEERGAEERAGSRIKTSGSLVARVVERESLIRALKRVQLNRQSQREPDYDRAARRVDRIRDKLGWEPGILNGKGWKPQGMHWHTSSNWLASTRLCGRFFCRDDCAIKSARGIVA